MKRKLLLRLFALIAFLLSSMSAVAAEAYANYTPSNTTLTFYYDDLRSTRTGTTYDLNTGNGNPAWRADGIHTSVTHVIFDTSFANARPTTTYSWFSGMTNLRYFTGMANLNTSEVTNMANMFNQCTSLTNLDLSHFNTANVTDMNRMFISCSGLTGLDLSNFNTAKVTNMERMLSYCSSLRTIYAGNGWSTTAVTNSVSMFYASKKLVGGMGTTYDVDHVDAARARIDGGPSSPGYFTAVGAEPWVEPAAYACYTLSNTTLTFYYDNQRSTRPGTTYDLNTGDIAPGWYLDGTNTAVTAVVFDSSFGQARPTTTYSWFSSMNHLQSITGMNYLNTSELTDMSWMFSYSTSLTSLDLGNFNTEHVTKMNGVFYKCSNLRAIYVRDCWTTATVTSSTGMFYNCTNLVGSKGTTYDENHIDAAYAHIDGGPSNPGYLSAPLAYAVLAEADSTLTFYCDNLQNSRPGSIYQLNTGSDNPGWMGDNLKVTKVVFDPSFADARPTSARCWFSGMENLVSITGMTYLNTSEVTNMYCMFYNCNKLTSLDLSNFDTEKVTNMKSMFQNCSGLTTLDLSTFNTPNLSVMNFMFRHCTSLRTIYAGEGWNTDAVVSQYDCTGVFTDCPNLVGGKGTTYDASHVDKAYAHIDGGPSNPGYFTAKSTALRGDVNGDNNVTIADVSALIDYLLDSSNTINMAGADCNTDNDVTIADVSALIDYLLSGAW